MFCGVGEAEETLSWLVGERNFVKDREQKGGKGEIIPILLKLNIRGGESRGYPENRPDSQGTERLLLTCPRGCWEGTASGIWQALLVQASKQRLQCK